MTPSDPHDVSERVGAVPSRSSMWKPSSNRRVSALTMLLAIGLQESRFTFRDQVVPGKAPGQVGPATGFWQFERAGGVAGVMQHPRSAEIARVAADHAAVA